MFSQIPQTPEQIEALLRGTVVYPRSVQAAGGEVLCFAKDAHQHYLLAVFNPQLPPFLREGLSGEVQDLSETLAVKWCFPSHSNAKKLRALFPWTGSHSLGETPTLAVRDLIGLAAPGIIAAHAAHEFSFALAFEAAPGELAALSRTMDEASDAVTFAVFQENYRRPWAMRAAELSTADEELLDEKLGYTEFAFAHDHAAHGRAEKEAWLDAALQTVAQGAPELFGEIEADGAEFAQWWTARTETGAWRFRDRVYRTLLDNEAEHFKHIHDAALRLFTEFEREIEGGREASVS